MAHSASWRGRGARPYRFGLGLPALRWDRIIPLTLSAAVSISLIAAGCQHLQGA